MAPILHPEAKSNLTELEQDELYDRLFQATQGLGQSFNFQEAEYLIKQGVAVDTPRGKNKHNKMSIVANIVCWCRDEQQTLSLLKLIYERDTSAHKSLIRQASFHGINSLILGAIENNKTNFPVANFLIDVAKVPVDQQDLEGKTALAYIVGNGAKPMLKTTIDRLQYLVNKGADPTFQDKNGRYLFSYVRLPEVRQALLDSKYGERIRQIESEQQQKKALEQTQIFKQIDQARQKKEQELAKTQSTSTTSLLTDIYQGFQKLLMYNTVVQRPAARQGGYQPIPQQESADLPFSKKPH